MAENKAYDLTSRLLGIPKNELMKMDIHDIEEAIRKKNGVSGYVKRLFGSCVEPFYAMYPVVTQEDFKERGITS